MTKVKKYLSKVYEAALDAHITYQKIPMSILLAVSALESSWGLSEGAVYHNAYFNIKQKNDLEPSYDKYVKEFDDSGAIYWKTCQFREFDSIRSSFIDFARYISTNPRYRKCLDVIDYEEFAQELYMAGYATEPEYRDLIVKIIRRENLDMYDTIY